MLTRGFLRERLTITIAPLLCCVATPPLIAEPDLPARPDKISPGVLWRQTLQEQFALDRAEPDADRLVAMGLDTATLGALRCAIYVDSRLNEQQLAELAADGVNIIESSYLPPVQGMHPFGVYIADVAHTSFDTLRSNAKVTRVDAAPRPLTPLNDLSSVVTDTSSVRVGIGVSKNDGSGVTIAIADTGLDLTHPDFPAPIEAFDVTDGDTLETWGLSVANTVSAHGTHVAGSALGRGTASGGAYSGSAPGANLVFYKIGNDTSGSASVIDIAEAITRAASIGCDIFSLSFGGLSDYLDGSEFVEQAIDATYQQGMLCFVAAGNSGDDDLHISVDVPANGASGIIEFTVDNEGFDAPFEFFEIFQINWVDTPGDHNLTLDFLATDKTATMDQLFYDFSLRGTELDVYEFDYSIPADESRTYQFVIRNEADFPVQAQLFANIGFDSYFVDADPGYTVLSPAVADTAIAVGSVNHRGHYDNYLGDTYDWSDLIGDPLQISHFSSRGPRIDGVLKPDLVAPGAMMISCRESVPGLANREAQIIDDDNQDLDGTGSAQYYVNAGTSMACPTAAGAAALLIEAHSYLGIHAIRDAVIKNASKYATPDSDWGYGIIAAKQSVLHGPATGVMGDIDGDFSVGIEDLSILIGEFGGNDDLADLNNDRRVDTADLGMLILNYGTGVTPGP
jgi:subtilisin family serine protease